MKNFLISILAVLMASAAHADLASVNAATFQLDHGNLRAINQVGTSVYKSRVHSAKCTYDFAVSGGSSSANIKLLDSKGQPCSLPNKAIIRDVLIDVITAPTSGGSATISLGSGVTAVDFKALTAIASYTGLVAGIPVGSAATAIKLAADQTPVAKIAVAPLTAGKFNVQIQYQLSE
jgi:hypothetical protein